MLRPSLSPSPRSACGALSIRHYGFHNSYPVRSWEKSVSALPNAWEEYRLCLEAPCRAGYLRDSKRRGAVSSRFISVAQLPLRCGLPTSGSGFAAGLLGKYIAEPDA